MFHHLAVFILFLSSVLATWQDEIDPIEVEKTGKIKVIKLVQPVKYDKCKENDKCKTFFQQHITDFGKFHFEMKDYENKIEEQVKTLDHKLDDKFHAKVTSFCSNYIDGSTRKDAVTFKLSDFEIEGEISSFHLSKNHLKKGIHDINKMVEALVGIRSGDPDEEKFCFKKAVHEAPTKNIKFDLHCQNDKLEKRKTNETGHFSFQLHGVEIYIEYVAVKDRVWSFNTFRFANEKKFKFRNVNCKGSAEFVAECECVLQSNLVLELYKAYYGVVGECEFQNYLLTDFAKDVKCPYFKE